jgi:cysteine synthase
MRPYFRALFSSLEPVETALFELFSRLLGTHASAARIIVASGINQQTLREIMLALGGQRLTTADYDKLEKLLARAKKATTKRNKLTHGTWRLNITVHKDKPNTATWERFYEPTDPRLYAEMAGPKMKQKSTRRSCLPSSPNQSDR